jgi:hypothetical protein
VSAANEPVAVGALLRILLTLAVSFGLNLSAEQIGLIVSAASILEAWLVRARVTPWTGE